MKAFWAVALLSVAVIAACVVLAVKSDQDCQSKGGHTVTHVDYGFRHTPGTGKYEYGPIYTSTCER